MKYFVSIIHSLDQCLTSELTASLNEWQGYIDHPVEPESNATDGIELFEDSQLTSRSKAIATKTKEIEQVRIQSA